MDGATALTGADQDVPWAGSPTPHARGFRQPAEWTPHQACWLAWPSHEDLWHEELAAAQAALVALCGAIADLDPLSGCRRGECLEILVPDAAQRQTAAAALQGVPARFHQIPFGDVWLRDTAPIFTTDEAGAVLAVCFQFNGWAGKYLLPGDSEVAAAVAEVSGVPSVTAPLVLEGGSVDVDGEGTCLTTRQCLLHQGRNPGLSIGELERGLRDFLGADTVIWLDEGLMNDHTDGHVDTLARFVAPGVVLCMEPAGPDDPNRAALQAIIERLRSSRDHAGRRVQVVTVPSPGAVLDRRGNVMPASYVNFYIANRTVAVPTYGVAADERALRAVAELFPGRRAVAIPARAVLSGGGAFHCITQQQPAAVPRQACAAGQRRPR